MPQPIGKDIIQTQLWLQHLRVLRATAPALALLCERDDHAWDAEEIALALDAANDRLHEEDTE